jgi:hypothetical protein
MLRKLKYMVMSPYQHAGQDHNIKTGKPCERVEQFRYLGATLTNQNNILEERKSILKLGTACYPVQNLLSSSLLRKNIKIKTGLYRTIILPVVLYGCETWSLTLREERSLRVFDNRVLRRIFGPNKDEVTGE